MTIFVPIFSLNLKKNTFYCSEQILNKTHGTRLNKKQNFAQQVTTRHTFFQEYCDNLTARK